MPAEVDLSRCYILGICCYAAAIRADLCPRRANDLYAGHALADERGESWAALCRNIELACVRVSGLYFLLPLYGANGSGSSPYVLFTYFAVFDTLQDIIYWSLLLIGRDHIAHDRISRPELAQTH